MIPVISVNVNRARLALVLALLACGDAAGVVDAERCGCVMRDSYFGSQGDDACPVPVRVVVDAAAENLARRSPLVLKDAIQLDRPDVPSRIETGPIRPVLDVYASGWACFEPQKYSWTYTGPASGAPTIAANPDVWRVVNHVSVRLVSCPNPSVVWVFGVGRAIDGGFGAQDFNADFFYESSAAAGNRFMPWSHISGGSPYWLIPPGVSLAFSLTDPTPTGGFYGIAVSWVDVPVGFKPI